MRKLLLLSSSLLALSACDLAPDYTLPKFTLPSYFKEQPKAQADIVAPTDGAWHRFDEKAQLDETAWWKIFNDPTLDALEAQAMADNPGIDAALARVKAARGAADSARSGLFPEVDVSFSPTREKDSVAGITARQPGATVSRTKPYTLYNANTTITYEADLFGRTKNRILVLVMGAEAEEQNLRTARLALQAELAQTYFALASHRSELALVGNSAAAQRERLTLTRKKRHVGEIDVLALASEEAELATTEATQAQLKQLVDAQEHALAALVGKLPSNFDTTTVMLKNAPPKVPAGLPSSLLERRPDIQAAARNIAAANAQIGVARTGYFPTLGLTLDGGFSSGDLENLFAWSNRSWLIGPLLTQPIFQGGRAAAVRAERDAQYQEATANYRAAVLAAFREVEDSLSGLRNLSTEADAHARSLKAAKRAFEVASMRYKVGDISYLDYLTAQRSFLAAQRGDVAVRGNQYITSVQLIRALGGGWNAPTATDNAAPIAAPVAAATLAQPKLSPLQ